ncbi:MAG: mitochondrial fission ELM1 family protein [Magnetococcales bacterium]|nr:mitochondrial fission ELM1 family protein [Magnetococcales bacterium]
MNSASASARRDGLKRTTPLVVWRLLDGKPGHENQTRGLVAGLRLHLEVELFNFQAGSRTRGVWEWLTGTFRGAPGGFQRPPDLIIGAGHATHFPLLAAKRRYGGRTIVLMKPSLPPWMFDLCLMPEHDGAMPLEKVVPTLGVLNTIRPSERLDPGKGLFLIGGPSKHYGWDNDSILQQIAEIIDHDSEIQWRLTTSRRTPESFLPKLRAIASPTLSIVPYSDTGPQWVPGQLEEAGCVWASEDSVSMVYEALTAGGKVGALTVPALGESRVNLGLLFLLEKRFVIPFTSWRTHGWEGRLEKRFCEAERCAEEVVKQWFSELL